MKIPKVKVTIESGDRAFEFPNVEISNEHIRKLMIWEKEFPELKKYINSIYKEDKKLTWNIDRISNKYKF